MLRVLKAGTDDLKVIVSLSDRYGYEELKRLLNRDFVRIYKLQSGEELVGFAVVWIIGGEGELHWFEILKPFRGMGFAEPFLEGIIKELKKEGVKRLLLEVSENNKVALRVYKKLGLKTSAVRKNYYPDGSDAIIMERELTDFQQTLEKPFEPVEENISEA